MRNSIVVAFPLLLSLVSCGSFSSPEHYLRTGNTFFEQGRWDDAVLQYRKALQKNPNLGEACYRLGLAYARRGSPQEAFDAFRRSVELASGHQDQAMAELGDLALTSYVRDGRRSAALYEIAEQMAEKLLKKNPESFEGFRLRGNLAMIASKPTAAVDAFQRADRARPDQPDVVFSLVQALLLDGQNQAAESKARALIEKKRDYGPVYDVLYALYRRTGRLSEAEAVLRQKTTNNPGDAFFATQLAEFYWSSGRKADAELVLASLPSTPESRTQIGDFYTRIGQWNEATAAYREALKASRGAATPIRRQLVSALLAQGKSAEAATELEIIVRENPEDTASLASRASLRLASGTPAESAVAVAEFRQLVAKNPKNASHHYQLSRALRYTGQNDEADKELHQVVGLNPQHREALGELASLAIRAENPGAALDYAQKALELGGKDPQVRLVRTAAWALQKEFKLVRPELQKLIKEFPTLAEPRIQMALLDLAERRYDSAAQIFQQQYKPDLQDIRPLKGMAEVAFARNQPNQAFALVDREYRRVSAGSGKPSRVLLELAAITADRAGQRAAAIDYYQKLIEGYPPPRSADLVRLGQLAHAQGDTQRSLASLEKARQIAPKDPLPPAVLGAVLSESGRWEEAVRCYRDSLSLNPNDAAVMNNLSFALADRGVSLEEALQLAQKAVERAPERLEFLDTLGYVHIKRHNADSAIQVFRNMVRRTGTPQSHLRLSTAFQLKGETQHARAELELALKANPTTKEADLIRSKLVEMR